MRVFFSATIGFTIPSLVNAVGWTPRAFGIGVVLAIIAIIGKMSTGLYSWQPNLRFVIGTSMCGRGEFSFLIINQSALLGVVVVEEFVATIIGLLITTIVSPFMFIYAFKKVSHEWPPKEAGAATVEQLNQSLHKKKLAESMSPSSEMMLSGSFSNLIRSPTGLDKNLARQLSPVQEMKGDLPPVPSTTALNQMELKEAGDLPPAPSTNNLMQLDQTPVDPATKKND
jgi:hypothetical protein